MPTRVPLIFWLLLAATLSIDAVVFSHPTSNFTPPFASIEVYFPVICDALLASQLSVICIWAALNFEKILWLPVLVGVIAATFVATLIEIAPEPITNSIRTFGALYGLEAGLQLIGLWLLRSSKYWRRRCDKTQFRQFSLAQLLLLMTAIAILATMMRSGPFADESKWLSFGIACSVVVMGLASATIWSLSSRWFFRFAATLGIAIVLAELLSLLPSFGSPAFSVFGAYFLVQAVMLSAWLGWGPIIPPRINSASFDAVKLPQ
jgi:hypothetical protein